MFFLAISTRESTENQGKGLFVFNPIQTVDVFNPHQIRLIDFWMQNPPKNKDIYVHCDSVEPLYGNSHATFHILARFPASPNSSPEKTSPVLRQTNWQTTTNLVQGWRLRERPVIRFQICTDVIGTPLSLKESECSFVFELF